MCSSDLELLAALGGGNVLARASAPLPRLTTMAVSMPVAVPQLWVQMADAPSAAGARRVDIQPTLLVPEGQRVHADVRRVESVPGRPDAYLAYVNDYAFAEGGVFWTRGTGEASVMVATGGAPFVALTLHAGPKGSTIRVVADGREQQVVLAPEETRRVSLAAGPGASVVAVRVQSSTSIRPADIAAGATDTRDLGCQVRVDVADAAG